jgi:hypothetical protein
MDISPFLLFEEGGRNIPVRLGNILGVLDDLPRVGAVRQVGYRRYRVWVDWLKLDTDRLVEKLSDFDFSLVSEWRLKDLDDLYRMYGCNAEKFKNALCVIRDVLKSTKDVPVVGVFVSETVASRLASSVLDDVRSVLQKVPVPPNVFLET